MPHQTQDQGRRVLNRPGGPTAEHGDQGEGREDRDYSCEDLCRQAYEQGYEDSKRDLEGESDDGRSGAGDSE